MVGEWGHGQRAAALVGLWDVGAVFELVLGPGCAGPLAPAALIARSRGRSVAGG